MWDIVVTYFLLATGIVANKFLLNSISSDLFVGLRMSISGFLLLPILLKNGLWNKRHYLKEDWLSLLGISFCTTLIPSLIKAFALKNMGASKNTLLGSIDPFVTAILAYLLFGEKLSLKKIGGICVGAVGVIMVHSLCGDVAHGGYFLRLSYPEIAALCGIIISRYGWMFVQLLLKKERYHPSEMSGITMIMSGCMVLFIIAAQGNSIVPIQFFESHTRMMIFFYTIFFGNLCGYTMYSRCLKQYSATWMSLAGFSIPLFVIFLSKLFAQETIHSNIIFAAIILFFGLLIFYMDEFKKMRVS